MLMPPYGVDLQQTGQGGYANEAWSTVHLAVTIFLRLSVNRTTAVVSIRCRLIHVMRGLLIFFHVHVAESSLQGLGTDRQN